MVKSSQHKVVASLPAELEPDAHYYVRTGAGFDHYIVDSTGSIAHKHNVEGGGGSGPRVERYIVTLDSAGQATITFDPPFTTPHVVGNIQAPQNTSAGGDQVTLTAFDIYSLDGNSLSIRSLYWHPGSGNRAAGGFVAAGDTAFVTVTEMG